MNLTEKPPKIESGIPGIELCPKCLDMTCFVLPNYDLNNMYIIDYSCPRCLKIAHLEKSN